MMQLARASWYSKKQVYIKCGEVRRVTGVLGTEQVRERRCWWAASCCFLRHVGSLSGSLEAPVHQGCAQSAARIVLSMYQYHCW